MSAEELAGRDEKDGSPVGPGPAGGYASTTAPDGDGAPPTTAAPDQADLVDRKAAFSGRPPPFPRSAIFAIAATVAVVAILAAVLNHLATSGTSGPAPQSPRTAHGFIGGATAPPDSSQLHGSLSDLMGLTSLKGQRPVTWSLTDARTGRTVTLRSFRGHVVVLTFADADCRDICPVLGSELDRAAAVLATTKVPVTFVTVNTDPLALTPKQARILDAPAFRALTRWRFVTGTVPTLNRVWTDYGISITVNEAKHKVSHNDLMYFIGTKGRLAWSAIPFADEAPNGSYTVSPKVAARFAQGIAHYAGALAGS